MALPQREFDQATARFTNAMYCASSWKDHYFGAAYSTRLEQAIRDARAACDEMETVLARDNQPVKNPDQQDDRNEN